MFSFFRKKQKAVARRSSPPRSPHRPQQFVPLEPLDDDQAIGGVPVFQARASDVAANQPDVKSDAPLQGSISGPDPVVPAVVVPIKVYDKIEELPFIEKTLYDIAGLAHSFQHKICPVITDSSKNEFAIILLDEMRNQNAVHTLVEALTLKSYVKATEFFHVASAHVMFQLARGEGQGVQKRNERTKASLVHGHDDSALKSLFESAARFALKNNASDLHIRIDRSKSQSSIDFRVDGQLCHPPAFRVSTDILVDMVAYMYNLLGKSGSENTFNENTAQQCQIRRTIDDVNLIFRWASHQTSRGTKVVLRMLREDDNQNMRSLAELGYLPPQVDMWKTAIGVQGGGIVVSGVVGSGKSTTGQTVMSMFPTSMSKYSVEDPVEYIIPDTDQFSVSRTLSDSDKGNDPFISAKRQIKRMDPDVVLIGEIRDYESAGLFRDVAESGHRALTTVHAPSAIDMITLRLASTELGIPRDVIATPGFLNLLVYQALVPLNCEHCKIPATSVAPGPYLEKIERLFGIAPESVMFRNPEGCDHCRREGLPELNGIKGRTVVAEMVELDHEMLKLYRDCKNLELKNYVRKSRTAKFTEPDSTGKSVLEVAMYKVAQGIVDPQLVERKFGNFYQYEKELNNINSGNSSHGVPKLAA